MKKVRLMTTAALVAIAGFTTISLTSCTKDDVVCAVGLEGKNCDQEVRVNYYNTYTGTGSDDFGGTYTDWGVRFSERGTEATGLKLEILDAVGVPQIVVNASLKTNTTFKVEQTTAAGGEVYTGQGTVNENSASLTLIEEYSGETTVFTFNNMSK